MYHNAVNRLALPDALGEEMRATARRGSAGASGRVFTNNKKLHKQLADMSSEIRTASQQLSSMAAVGGGALPALAAKSLGSQLATMVPPILTLVLIIGCIIRIRRQRACKYAKYRIVGDGGEGGNAVD